MKNRSNTLLGTLLDVSDISSLKHDVLGNVQVKSPSNKKTSYEILTINPMKFMGVRSRDNGKIYFLDWDDVLLLAKASGIDD